jgi:MFS family permease
VAPAVITGELMRDFHISAAALGNLSAFYFYSYVAMQIPTGILADRWGPRRLLTLGALVAAMGAVMFALAPSLAWASVGRLLIGGSVAVAFVGLLKVAASWFVPHRFALLSGLALLFGIVGAVFAGPPLRILVDYYGWRTVVLFSALLTLFVGVGTWVVVRDYPHDKGYRDFSATPSVSGSQADTGIIAGVFQVFTYPNTVLLFVIPGGMVGCVLTFSGLWGVPYLTTLHGISSASAATLTSALLVAWAIGGPVFGWLSDRLGNRKILFLVGCGISVVGWGVMVLVDDISLALLVPVLLITGFASGSMIISFAFVKESVPTHLSGTVSGVINMGVMIGPMVLQPAVGWVLDHMWTGAMAAGVRVYPVAAYRVGFALMLAWIALSFVLLLFTRETGCRQTVE